MILIHQLVANANELDAMADVTESKLLVARLRLSAELQRKAAQALNAPKNKDNIPYFLQIKTH